MIKEKSVPSGKMSEADQLRQIRKELSKCLVIPLFKKHGVDKVRAEQEQYNLDRLLLWLTTIYLIFSGHIFIGILWMTRIPIRSLLQCGYEGFDDALIDEI
jgi:hypothetical protein